MTNRVVHNPIIFGEGIDEGDIVVCESIVDGEALEDMPGTTSTKWLYCTNAGGYIFLPLLERLP